MAFEDLSSLVATGEPCNIALDQISEALDPVAIAVMDPKETTLEANVASKYA